MSNFSDASQRLCDAAKILLEKMDEDGTNCDLNGDPLPEVAELRAALDEYEQAWDT